MWQYVVGLTAVAVVAVQTVASLEERRQIGENGSQTSSSVAVVGLDTPAPQTNQEIAYYEGRTARIDADARGHFVTTAKMNGRRIEVLVDTGATTVAINKSTARRLGIRLKKSDFKYTVNTANGQTKAASATIDRISIGRVSVKDVQAAVLDDRALDGTLLGMSFLKELRKFEISNGELVLTQ